MAERPGVLYCFVASKLIPSLKEPSEDHLGAAFVYRQQVLRIGLLGIRFISKLIYMWPCGRCHNACEARHLEDLVGGLKHQLSCSSSPFWIHREHIVERLEELSESQKHMLDVEVLRIDSVCESASVKCVEDQHQLAS